MTVYRVTVKTWDRHFGQGTPVFTWKKEARRRSRKADAEASAVFMRALIDWHPKGKSEARAEVSDRHGVTTLERAVSEDGNRWRHV